MLPNDEPWDRAGLADLRARQRTELHTGPEMIRPPEQPAGTLSPVDARAAEWALRRVADQIVSDTPGLRGYLDSCLAHRAPELALGFVQGSNFDPFSEDLLQAKLTEARGAYESPRYSVHPEIRAEVIAWVRALRYADHLAAMSDAAG
jgi:hypothetical protein